MRARAFVRVRVCGKSLAQSQEDTRKAEADARREERCDEARERAEDRKEREKERSHELEMHLLLRGGGGGGGGGGDAGGAGGDDGGAGQRAVMMMMLKHRSEDNEESACSIFCLRSTWTCAYSTVFAGRAREKKEAGEKSVRDDARVESANDHHGAAGGRGGAGSNLLALTCVARAATGVRRARGVDADAGCTADRKFVRKHVRVELV